MSKIVIALGGNALGKTPSEQLRLVKQTALNIVDIIWGMQKQFVMEEEDNNLI